MAFTVPRSQPNGIPMGDFGLMCETALSTTIIKTPNDGISVTLLYITLEQHEKPVTLSRHISTVSE